MKKHGFDSTFATAAAILLCIVPLAVASLVAAVWDWGQDGQWAQPTVLAAPATAHAPPGRLPLQEFLRRDLPAALDVVFLGSGIYALCIWCRRRQSFGYMLFFCLSVISFAAHLHFYLYAPLEADWFAWATIATLAGLIASIHFLLLRPLLARHHAMLTGGAAALAGLFTLLTWPGMGPLPALSAAPLLVPVTYGMALAMAAAVSLIDMAQGVPKFKGAQMVASCTGICILLGLADGVMHPGGLTPDGWFLGAYINIVALVLIGILLYRRYSVAIARVERANIDLAERLRARETELEQSHQRLREAERLRLMQDMHDGLGSSLISAIRTVEQGNVDDGQVSQILKECLDDLKLTIDSMEPVEADLLLLLATLRFRLGPRLEGSGITMAWEVLDLPALPWLDRSASLHILRILQEGFANILHHAQASRIRVGTASDGAGISITIEDDGRGFDPDQALAGAKGRGLHNQRRRAHSIGGAVAWQSGPAGTRFTLQLPLDLPESRSEG